MLTKYFGVICLLIVICLLLNGCKEEDYLIDRGNREAKAGNYKAAIKRYDDVLKINPRNANAYYNRGIVWFEMGEMDNAISDYTKALEIDKELTEAYFNRAFIWRSKGNYDRAISDYTKALLLNPNNSLKNRIYFSRALTWYKRGDYERTIGDLTEGINLDSRNPEAYFYRAEAWYEKGNFDRAISDYSKAIEINPKYTKAVFDRANTLHEKGNFAAAITDYERAIELDPQNALIYNNYSWLLSTCTNNKFRDGTKALKLALKAVEMRSGEAIYLSTLAAAYAESGNFIDAIKAEEKAISLLEKGDLQYLKDMFITQLESYKAGKPWREDVKRENWMRNYKIEP
jgi:tetratricopeptide (TPR) repeat protein